MEPPYRVAQPYSMRMFVLIYEINSREPAGHIATLTNEL